MHTDTSVEECVLSEVRNDAHESLGVNETLARRLNATQLSRYSARIRRPGARHAEPSTVDVLRAPELDLPLVGADFSPAEVMFRRGREAITLTTPYPAKVMRAERRALEAGFEEISITVEWEDPLGVGDVLMTGETPVGRIARIVDDGFPEPILYALNVPAGSELLVGRSVPTAAQSLFDPDPERDGAWRPCVVSDASLAWLASTTGGRTVVSDLAAYGEGGVLGARAFVDNQIAVAPVEDGFRVAEANRRRASAAYTTERLRLLRAYAAAVGIAVDTEATAGVRLSLDVEPSPNEKRRAAPGKESQIALRVPVTPTMLERSWRSVPLVPPDLRTSALDAEYERLANAERLNAGEDRQAIVDSIVAQTLNLAIEVIQRPCTAATGARALVVIGDQERIPAAVVAHVLRGTLIGLAIVSGLAPNVRAAAHIVRTCSPDDFDDIANKALINRPLLLVGKAEALAAATFRMWRQPVVALRRETAERIGVAEGDFVSLYAPFAENALHSIGTLGENPTPLSTKEGWFAAIKASDEPARALVRHARAGAMDPCRAGTAALLVGGYPFEGEIPSVDTVEKSLSDQPIETMDVASARIIAQLNAAGIFTKYDLIRSSRDALESLGFDSKVVSLIEEHLARYQQTITGSATSMWQQAAREATDAPPTGPAEKTEATPTKEPLSLVSRTDSSSRINRVLEALQKTGGVRIARGRAMTEADLRDTEAALHMPLPEDYRAFLLEFGSLAVYSESDAATIFERTFFAGSPAGETQPGPVDFEAATGVIELTQRVREEATDTWDGNVDLERPFAAVLLGVNGMSEAYVLNEHGTMAFLYRGSFHDSDPFDYEFYMDVSFTRFACDWLSKLHRDLAAKR